MKGIHSSRKIIVLCIIITIILSGCDNKKEAKENDLISSDVSKKQEKVFAEFLEGKTVCGEKDRYIWEIMQDYQGGYTYCDVDADGEEELNIRSDDRFCIIKYNNSNLEIIFEDSTYYYPINENGVNGIIYYEPECQTANEGTSYKYQFYTICENGTREKMLDFQWCDVNSDRQQGNEDQYFYNGEEVHIEEWMEKTEEYRNCSSFDYDIWEKYNIDNGKGKSIEFTDYAIYPSVITEENPSDKSPYLIWPTSIQLQFPQFYYSRENEVFNEEIEIKINEKLFSESIQNDTSDLINRNNTDVKEHNADYMITLADEDMFSIRFESSILGVSYGNIFCSGRTVDTHTGKEIKISDFVIIDDSLIEKVKNKEIQCFTPGYHEDYIMSLLESFLKDYDNGMIDLYSCFYVDEEYVYLIVPTMGGNLNYYTLRIERYNLNGNTCVFIM